MTGRTSTPPEIIAEIARYFHVTTDYLLGLTDEREPPLRTSAAEKRLVEEFRTLSRQQKELVCQMIRLMLEQNQR